MIDEAELASIEAGIAGDSNATIRAHRADMVSIINALATALRAAWAERDERTDSMAHWMTEEYRRAKERDAALTRLDTQTAYSIALQRLIEALARGDVPAVTEEAPHESKVAQRAAGLLVDALAELEQLHDDIDEHLPEYDIAPDGEEVDEANARERIEYAGLEIKRLTKERDEARAEVERLKAICGKNAQDFSDATQRALDAIAERDRLVAEVRLLQRRINSSDDDDVSRHVVSGILGRIADRAEGKG